MKRIVLAGILAMACLVLATAPVVAEEKSYSLGYEISKDPAGMLKLRVNTSALASGLWLGVTLYTPTGSEVENHIFPIKQGKGMSELVINPKFINGTLEAAVWTKKLTRDECLKTDDFCQKNGYRATGMVAYIWRYIVSP